MKLHKNCMLACYVLFLWHLITGTARQHLFPIFLSQLLSVLIYTLYIHCFSTNFFLPYSEGKLAGPVLIKFGKRAVLGCSSTLQKMVPPDSALPGNRQKTPNWVLRDKH